MSRRPLTIAVTGLNATDNPAPGVGVLRSLKLGEGAQDRLVGLAYDALDPGVYAQDLAQDIFMLPYPSSSVDAYLARIAHVHQRVGLDVIIPTLDAELPAFLTLAPRLKAMGIGTLLPTRDQLDARNKARLAAMGKQAGISVPATAVVQSADEMARVHERIAYPFFVKGAFYGATLVHSVDEALGAFHKAAAQWGLPIVVQSVVRGEELNVVALGDGQGGMTGAVPMKKLLLTDKGKGWAGITIDDRALLDLARRFFAATKWRGPCEVEVIRDEAGGYHLLEINPRFPAWVHLAAASGVNLPRAAAQLAAGLPLQPLGDYRVGTMFVRISFDQITTLADFEKLVTAGELSRARGAVVTNASSQGLSSSPALLSTSQSLEGALS
jgi:carbamoyl-phosphate synthase large subunit